MKTGNNGNVDIGLQQVSEWILESVRMWDLHSVAGSQFFLFGVSVILWGVRSSQDLAGTQGKRERNGFYWVGQKVCLGFKKRKKRKNSLSNPIHEVLWAGPKSGIHSFHQLRHSYSSVHNFLGLCGQEKDGAWKTSSQHHCILSSGREQHSIWMWGKKLNRAQGLCWSGDEVPNCVWTIEVLLETRRSAQST